MGQNPSTPSNTEHRNSRSIPVVSQALALTYRLFLAPQLTEIKAQQPSLPLCRWPGNDDEASEELLWLVNISSKYCHYSVRWFRK